MSTKGGTERTRRFYDEEGWQTEQGMPVDRKLFGIKEDGPIRVELHHLHVERVRRALAPQGAGLNLLECGCGGNPDRALLDLCSRYTGVDFSASGLKLASSNFADVTIPYEFRLADVCALPFEDGVFDAAYSAHMIYHIEDPAAQEAAIAELLRVVRPGGVVVIVTANARPLSSPTRLARRLVAEMPLLGAILNRVRRKPPLPYRPMPIGWLRRRLARGGEVDVLTYSLPSTTFNQRVTEFRGAGKLLWKAVRWLDVNHPRFSIYLANYVMLTCRRTSARQDPVVAITERRPCASG